MTGEKRDWMSPREPQGRTAAVAQDLERIFGGAAAGQGSSRTAPGGAPKTPRQPKRRAAAVRATPSGQRRPFRISPAHVGGAAALALLGLAAAIALNDHGPEPAPAAPQTAPQPSPAVVRDGPVAKLAPAPDLAPAPRLTPAPNLAPPPRLAQAQVALRNALAARPRSGAAVAETEQSAQPQPRAEARQEREATTTADAATQTRTAADGPCDGLSLPARVRCLYPAVLSADEQLRQSYDAAVRARVEPAVLLRYQDLWENLRRRAGAEPQRVIDSYREMARALDQMASDGRPRS